jgi:small subunit ribosomal protein S21
MNQKKNKGTGITVKEGENINVSLRRFKRKVEEAGTLDTLRAKEFYEKPTTMRKRKKSAAVNRNTKRLQKDSLPPKLY